MSYWDFIAPDPETFADRLLPVLPDFIPVVGVPVPKEAMVAAAWLSPFSGAGLFARVLYATSQTTTSAAASQAAVDAVNQALLGAPKQTITLKAGTAVAALVIPNVYRCALKMTAGGHDIVNVFHVEGSASGQEAAAAAAVLAAWKTAGGPLARLSQLITMVSVTAMDLSSVNGGITVVTDTTTGGISSTNALATRGACGLIKLNGGTRSRSTRGRIYYGPIMETDINSDGATVASASVTAWGTAFTNFRTSLSGAGFTLGVASRKTSSFTSATTTAVEATIATQRRRIR